VAAPLTEVPGIRWNQPSDLSRPETRQRLSPAALRGFFRIATAWNLRDEDARGLLGGISNGSFYQLKGGAKKRLDQDTLTRISLLIGIFSALNILYSQKLADAWIQLSNTSAMFAGESPLTYMLRGGVPAMMHVRQLLDARRGGE
jgi:antitoxin Xre/MbcA/ParS-like protein